jgi:hypothetical protein
METTDMSTPKRVTWTLPPAAAELILETLEADTRAANFDPVLRRRIKRALDSILEVGHAFSITQNPYALVGVCGCGALWSTPKDKLARGRLADLHAKHLVFVKGGKP